MVAQTVKAGLANVLLLQTALLMMNFITVDSGMAERRLLNDLMNQYNKLERPVYNESEPVTLTFGLTLQQIIDVVSFFFQTAGLNLMNKQSLGISS